MVALFDQVADRSVTSIAGVDIVLSDDPHPYEQRHRIAIDAGWAEESARNPRLFNGRSTLLSAVALDGGRLRGISHEIDFATFLHWRKQTDHAGSCHLFAFAVPVAADGALVAVKMGKHTANPGLVYFAAGSFERCDFPDRRMDVAANTHREVFEETGLDLGGLKRDGGFALVRAGTSAVLVRRYFLDQPATAIADRIRAHVAADPDPEIEGPVILRDSATDLPLSRHMPLVLDWHFGNAVR